MAGCGHVARRLGLAVVVVGLLAGCGGSGGSATRGTSGAALAPPHALSVNGLPAGLPLPSSLPRAEYEAKLYAFLSGFTYRNLGWKKDKWVRDCGNYSNGVYYAPHQAVRIYYSPEVFAWLKNGRQGIIPDGAVIVKELYPPPAGRYADRSQPLPQPQWVTMVRDSKGAKDGWFWSFYAVNLAGGPLAVDNDNPPFNYPNSDFGSSCLRCHASAETQFTFSALENIEGEPGEPLSYADDGSWRNLPPTPVTKATPAPRAALFTQPDFASTYASMTPPANATALPGVTTSDVVAGHGTQFVTSNQCMACHGGDALPLGPRMMVDDKKVDVSPWAEWSWSMMGLAGRDPVFYAQLESESALHAASGDLTPASIQNACLSCHGVMGQRQFQIDRGSRANFTVEQALSSDTYGALARDGVSCMVCHQMQPNDDVPLQSIQTGQFDVMPKKPDGELTVNGPYQNPTQFPMENSIGVKPVYNGFVSESRLCASCHTVNLPILDKQNRVLSNAYEQATYLEWLNSDFRAGAPGATSCQQCHMTNQYHGAPLSFKIASTHDQSYPVTTFLASLAQIFLGVRDNYARHTLLGLNQFALEMFNQFPEILGVRLFNPMSEVFSGLPTAIDSSQALARNTATVKLLAAARNGSTVTARVTVTNLTGHRFPSGVGFRRAFLEVTVSDAGGQIIWGCGRTNELGVIVDGAAQPLPSEFHRVVNGQQSWQPHYQTITAENQVQIYEELTQDVDGLFTTSFLSRAHVLKDNRLLPRGWTASGPPGFDPEFAHATAPEGDAANDPDFTDGSGSDQLTYVARLPAGAQGPFTVSARLHYQSMPPSFLADRFTTAHGTGTQRLYYLAQHLDPSRTNFPAWKLPVAIASATVP